MGWELSAAKSRMQARQRSRTRRGESLRATRSGREFRGVFVAKDADGLLELRDLERFLQDGDRTARQNPIQHFAVGITGNDDDGQVRIGFLRRFVNVVCGAVRQFQIEEKQIELLFFESGERFLHGADDDAAEANFLEENLEQALETFVVID